MSKHPLRIMIATMVVAYGLLAVTIMMGKTPTLGLDLQGGISVNLQPVKDGKVDDSVSAEQLDQAIGIIRKRVDALGVAEPEVSRQGNTIIVQLPGATDQQQVLDTVGKTAELRFRPVLADVGKVPTGADRKKAEEEVQTLRSELKVPEGVSAAQVATEEQEKQAAANPTPTTVPEATTTTTPPATTTTARTATTADPTAGNGGNRSRLLPAQDDTTTTTAPTTTTTTPTPLNQWGVNAYDSKFAQLYQLEQALATQTTSAEDDKADAEVNLADEDGNVMKLGPTLLTGQAVETASAGIGQDGKWQVNPVFRSGEKGIDLFNKAAALCNSGAAECPGAGGQPGRLAIVLDGEVLSAPTINNPSFERDSISISGSFTEDEAKNLAVALRFGSLPIELKAQQAETVSATLGEDALQAGIIAGAIGLLLVCAYLLFYYRLLGLATVGSLTISASILWVIMCWINATVTLAGVVGIVVSIGISLDSSIVFFETIKEDVRNGAGLRPSVDKAFGSAYSTIVKADMSSLIGAGVLYWLSVGPVRGFAFYLGVATLLDLVSAYFFLRPAALVLARSSQGEHPKRFGIPIDDLSPAARRATTGTTAPDPVAATTGEGA
ncbi:protein translocase subunit SecD [Dermatobacter hominis]|uniref:protein translocase subunit SecD n=1 Tax=Dermatobacter hominis TaxID=2884263 RepID=UPI001D12F1A5|nr:protein translocase subunit SecD [Dermatobacter hominis]UDY36165.1 protein translocase subunit SecD [Dermatobacter hominis]